MSKEIIEKFYSAFQRKDWKTMQSCYHDDAEFSDPVFQNLNVKQVKAMWNMLLASGGDLGIMFRDAAVSGNEGSCHWEATYLFSGSGRNVHNIIDAQFLFADGKILRHNDYFDLWRWSGMALGTPGKLLGWSPFLRKEIRQKAQKRLFQFISEHTEYQ